MSVLPKKRMESARTPSGINGFAITGPTGEAVHIPATAEEDRPYFTPDQRAAIRDYYEENGYVVIRGLLPEAVCRAAVSRFEEEVRPYRKFIYRQASANPERHVFTEHGFMLNPILNIQSLRERRFPGFRAAGLAVMTHSRMQAVLKALFSENGKAVQSMYFEGNPATWPHQDTYYLDAEQLGRMVGAWIALEDIAPGAGRFFVYPKSHLTELSRNGGGLDIAFHHDAYKRYVVDAIREEGLKCRAPALRRGDVLLWSSRTIHGSLETTQPEHSRSSITTHYIPDSSRFLQFQTRIRPLNVEPVNGMRVHKPKDLNRRQNQLIFFIETRFPKAFRAAKKIAIKAYTR